MQSIAGTSRVTGARSVASSRDKLERADIEKSGESSIYGVLATLRPNWLRKRGRISIMREESIRVYLDGIAQGGAEILPGIHSDGIGSVEFLTPAEATLRFGTGNPNGAIVMTSARPK